MGNLGQKRLAKGPKIVLPEIKSYPGIAWDMGSGDNILMSEESEIGGIWLDVKK